jgi:branched-subunit amino acid ABC-type transport system permease component
MSAVLAGTVWSQLPSLSVFGLVIGAVYALLALGLLVIYRGTRVFNLAHGATAMAGAYLFSGFVDAGIPMLLAFLGAAGACAAGGAVVERWVMRPVSSAGVSAQVVATLGIYISVQALVIMFYGAAPRFAPEIAPSGGLDMPGGFTVSWTQLLVFVVAGVLFAGVYLLYQRTSLGLQMQAVAISPEAASVQGIDTGRISMISWSLGSVCAGVAGILLAPLLILDTVGLPLIVIESFAAALIGGLASFPITLVGALVLGVLQSTSVAFTSNQGAKQLIAFALILAALLVRRNVGAERAV